MTLDSVDPVTELREPGALQRAIAAAHADIIEIVTAACDEPLCIELRTDIGAARITEYVCAASRTWALWEPHGT